MSDLSASSTALPSLLAGLGPGDAALLAPLRRWLALPPAQAESVFHRLLAALPTHAHMVLQRVQAHGGVYPVALLEAEFGPLRPCAAYSSPRVYLRSLGPPHSPVDELFIAGFIWLTSGDKGPAYAIPDELLRAMPPLAGHNQRLQLEPGDAPVCAQSADYERLERRIVALLDIARVGKLLLVRGGMLSSASIAHVALAWGTGAHSELLRSEAELLRFALLAFGVLRVGSNGQLRLTRNAIEWLALPRRERLQRLLAGWATSSWDALRHLLGFQLRTDTQRDLAATRHAILGLLAQAPSQCWLDVAAFCAEMRRLQPAFARPDGDFASWQLRDRLGRERDGFAHWDAVEGMLLRATIECDLHWLGLCDAGYDAGGHLRSFRLTPLAASLLNGEATDLHPERPIIVQPNFEIVVPPDAAPLARFQVARIAERVADSADETMAIYRLNRTCLETELDRGAQIDAICGMLCAAAAVELPPNVAYTLQEWGARRGRLRLRRVTLLHADDPLMLARLRRDRRLRLRGAEALGERSLALPEGAASTIAARLRRAGYSLADETHASGAPFSARELIRLAAALRAVQTHTDDRAGSALLERLLGMLNDEQRAAVDDLALTMVCGPTEETAPALHLSE